MRMIYLSTSILKVKYIFSLLYLKSSSLGEQSSVGLGGLTLKLQEK